MDTLAHTARPFHHPFEPYEVQKEFMEAVYSALENRQIGIFESPTGTGKSLCLICASMTWLRAHSWQSVQPGEYQPDQAAAGSDDEPAWVLEHEQKGQRALARERKLLFEKRLEVIREEERRQSCASDRTINGRLSHRDKRLKAIVNERDKTGDEWFAPDDETSLGPSTYDHPESTYSARVLDLLNQLNKTTKHDTSNHLEGSEIRFISELRLPSFPSSLPDETDTSEVIEPIKHIALGSRKNLCINIDVSKLGNVNLINERCLELQKQDPSTQNCKCPYMPSHDDAPTRFGNFRDHALAQIRDIEELATLGKSLNCCPYYATRASVPFAEIVTLPYPLLFHPHTRDILKLSMKNQIVLIDEAHNINDAISGMFSLSTTQSQYLLALQQLKFYLARFGKRLKIDNKVIIQQLVLVLKSISKFLEKINVGIDRQIEISELLAGGGVDQVNLYRVGEYLQKSKLPQKVDGYIDYMTRDTVDQNIRLGTPVLMHIQSFLYLLMNPSDEGSFFCRSPNGEKTLSYLLLDSSEIFRSIIEEARAVVLAGGTMSPMDDVVANLFPHVPATRIRSLSCKHVVSKNRVFVRVLSRGAHELDMEFTFERRERPKTIDELGWTILRLSSVIPAGMVVFFSSYNYLAKVRARWQTSTEDGLSIYNRLEETKSILYESQGQTGDENVLSTYTDIIAQGRGALLLAVVGGKLSEGINFADDLGRAVIIVGLPFPNPNDSVWKAKLEYIEKRSARLLANDITPDERFRQSKAAGREYYSNSCMRMVNQSIGNANISSIKSLFEGRAIRHKDDYASIILLDKRYESQHIQTLLSAWIRDCLVKPNSTLDQVTIDLQTFFNAIRQ